MVKNTFTFHAFKIFYFYFFTLSKFLPPGHLVVIPIAELGLELISLLILFPPVFFFFFNFLLQDVCFTILCWFLPHINMNQPQVYICPLFPLVILTLLSCANCILLSINTALKVCISFAEDFVKEHGRTFYFIIIILPVSSKLLVMVFLCMPVYFTHPETIWKRGHIVIRLFA